MFQFEFSGTDPESYSFLSKVTKIFEKNMGLECGHNCTIYSSSTVNVKISISDPSLMLNQYTDESYRLIIESTGMQVTVNITATNVFGARHALETVLQLMFQYTYPNNPSRTGLGLVMARIEDKPAYRYRGLLLDTSRNYLPMSTILRQIDGMAASKLNVLHWHATDSHSFPIKSQRVPELSSFGAYSSKQIYSLSDISYVVDYAKLRGVRVVMEIDGPSHAGNGWQWGPEANLGNLAVCVNKNPWRQYCIQPPCGQLNPANKNIYDILGDLYRDLLEILPTKEYFHMGGDEVFVPCWNSSEEIVSYMSDSGLGRTMDDFLTLWAEYHTNVLGTFDSIVGNTKTPVMIWSSHLTDPNVIEKYLRKDRYIIETWVPASDDLPYQLLNKGYKLVISTKDAWYLDHGFWGNTVYHNWRIAYQNRLPQHKGVLGGEVCMWGEYVDGNSLDVKIWPRAAAAAERLWADPQSDAVMAEQRFYRHRERLVSRGIEADAVTPRWCYLNEGQCT